MSVNNPYKAYQNNSVTTASPGELTLMLYNGCLKFISKGREAIEKGDVQAKNMNLQKAQAIIQEMIVTLDKKVPIAAEILPLYEFIRETLINANLKSDLKLLDDAEGLVKEFRDTWKEVLKVTRQETHGAGGQA